MKRMTIVKDDNLVGIDGIFFRIDCSELPENFHALQWNNTTSTGEIEWNGSPRPMNTIITSIAEYSNLVEAWTEAKAAAEAS